MHITREIDGTLYAGTAEQLDLVEEYVILVKDQKVTFPTDRGTRVGKVVGYNMSGGGSSPWRMTLVIRYRNGEYHATMDEIQLV